MTPPTADTTTKLSFDRKGVAAFFWKAFLVDVSFPALKVSHFHMKEMCAI